MKKRMIIVIKTKFFWSFKLKLHSLSLLIVSMWTIKNFILSQTSNHQMFSVGDINTCLYHKEYYPLICFTIEHGSRLIAILINAKYITYYVL